MHSVVCCMQESAELYGIDWDAPLPIGADDLQVVEVPDIPNPLTDEHYMELQTNIHPTSADSDYGVRQYLNVLDFVQSKVTQYS